MQWNVNRDRRKRIVTVVNLWCYVGITQTRHSSNESWKAEKTLQETLGYDEWVVIRNRRERLQRI